MKYIVELEFESYQEAAIFMLDIKLNHDKVTADAYNHGTLLPVKAEFKEVDDKITLGDVL